MQQSRICRLLLLYYICIACLPPAVCQNLAERSKAPFANFVTKLYGGFSVCQYETCRRRICAQVHIKQRLCKVLQFIDSTSSTCIVICIWYMCLVKFRNFSILQSVTTGQLTLFIKFLDNNAIGSRPAGDILLTVAVATPRSRIISFS